MSLPNVTPKSNGVCMIICVMKRDGSGSTQPTPFLDRARYTTLTVAEKSWSCSWLNSKFSTHTVWGPLDSY